MVHIKRVTMNLPEAPLKETMAVSKAQNRTDAVILALTEYLKQKKIEGRDVK